MKRWPVVRTWLIDSESEGSTRAKTESLVIHPVCCLLGTAGLGKTSEANHLVEIERQAGRAVRYEQLAMLATTADRLEMRLIDLAGRLPDGSALYLDGIDEAMLQVRTSGRILSAWVRETLVTRDVRLRFLCRSAVWPAELATAMRDTFGKQHVITATLQPMDGSDVHAVANYEGLEAEAFWRAVRRAGVEILARQPLTLGMLCRLYRANADLPRRRREIFSAGLTLLIAEKADRRASSALPLVSPADLLDGAERLACYLLLSGRDLVDLTHTPPETTLGWLEVCDLPGTPALDDGLLRALAASGLCAGDGANRFRFAHRQFAEYLAGRRLARLLPHQSKALLASALGASAGVAGPLRETAAFAAGESEVLATWIATCDPEIVGISDVAGNDLRRRATLGLLDRFRRHDITDAQLHRDDIRMAGFLYVGIEDDLRPVLQERDAGSEDVLECAIELIRAGELVSMSDPLADLALDRSAPLHPRQSAAHAISRFGTQDARRRLLPLIDNPSGDTDLDLYGWALKCNWPDHLTVPQMLAAIARDERPMYHGGYKTFLYNLDHSGFDAEGHVVEGLRWAIEKLPPDHRIDPRANIISRIARRALVALEEPLVADLLVDLLLISGERHTSSPLAAMDDAVKGDESSAVIAPLVGRVRERRRLLGIITGRDEEKARRWWALRKTPGLLVLEDFSWLLDRANDSSVSAECRRQSAGLAAVLPWSSDQSSVEVWLHHHERGTLPESLSMPLFIERDSELGRKCRKDRAQTRRLERLHRPRILKPSPVERVRMRLEDCEAKDPKWFGNLCQELTLKEDSRTYDFNRMITTMPGWTAADESTRDRIVSAAQAVLTCGTNTPEAARTTPFSEILSTYMPAVFLLHQQQPTWLERQPQQWWSRWAWYMLRELRPNMHQEENAPKIELFRLIYQHAPAVVRDLIANLIDAQDEDSRHLLSSMLDLIEVIPDDDLDQKLCTAIASASIRADRVREVVQFMLSRCPDHAARATLAGLDRSLQISNDDYIVPVAVALLHEAAPANWERLNNLLNQSPKLARKILSEFAHTSRRKLRHSIAAGAHSVFGLTAPQLGQLFSHLMRAYPPSQDRVENGEAHVVTTDDSARDLRNQFLTTLGDQSTLEAVQTLRDLERTFGGEYPWFRRPRARAERAYRLAHWGPISPASIAAILTAETKRLIRSGSDAVAGVIEALRQYEDRLHHADSSELECLWNLPNGQPPSPRTEEYVSDRLCQAVRSYFTEYAVTADREVQVFRRHLSKKQGGIPGSLVDVLVRIPAAGSQTASPIAVPIEVKLAHNPEAKTGLQSQLVDRYLNQLGTDFGVFAVVWMTAPSAAATHRPLWTTIPALESALNGQAGPYGGNIGTVVIDGSLPGAS